MTSMDVGFIIIAASFIGYLLLLLYFERKFLFEPRDVLDKFLAFSLLYAGISILYFAFTGETFLSESESSYRLYLFLIGVMSILWSVPTILGEFQFFKDFEKKGPRKKRKSKKGK